jgi:hypothetical protein
MTGHRSILAYLFVQSVVLRESLLFLRCDFQKFVLRLFEGFFEVVKPVLLVDEVLLQDVY